MADIKGAWAILPTPAKANASDWCATDTVDLDEAARAADGLVRAGVDGIFSLGTFGEGATLDWEEKKAFMTVVVDAIGGRVPFFGGATSLSTRQTVREMKAALDIGVDGVMLGVPMWCQVDTPTAVQFYRDVAEAVPALAISIYANPEAFKFDFPRPFWGQVAEIPQVVCSKYLGIANLVADLRLVKGRIRLMVNDVNYFAASRIDPDSCTAFWSSGAVCGPTVATRLRDEVERAKRNGDWAVAKHVTEEIAATLRTLFPHGLFSEFSKYNIGLEKARMDAAGWVKAGPIRPPYHIVPEPFLEGARQSGRAWAELAQQYVAERP
ncbi:trans-o-hydroxybenzylidenepyruvate hydratase-aldolase [Novosphingobium hassiacum]|uniref:Trans-O-hydroxybenzylidenepyruvate hydratase-aldolase n=1 Tax=Novosphingobium hassiacum TaxID=173676 RepID=A0A7W6A448_9SPHN|nr:trans-o-hydroxybenzylidenepyruvate hydratase-aldolase [Novosphingobium hassiacum]